MSFLPVLISFLSIVKSFPLLPLDNIMTKCNPNHNIRLLSSCWEVQKTLRPQTSAILNVLDEAIQSQTSRHECTLPHGGPRPAPVQMLRRQSDFGEPSTPLVGLAISTEDDELESHL